MSSIAKKLLRRNGPENARVLCISDLHAPYHHPDTLEFLKAVKKKYNPDRIVLLGDEVDHHAMSFHDSDPDLPSAGEELQQAIDKLLSPLYELFPVADIVDSNHGSMVYRKGKHHGIPRKYLRDYNEVLSAPESWQWSNDLTITASNGQEIYFVHGIKKNGIMLARSMGMSCVQGHYHTEFSIHYSSSPKKLMWSMQIGCSIDDHNLAFHYNKVTPGRPIIGHGIILDGMPKLLPMVLNTKGRWTGYVP